MAVSLTILGAILLLGAVDVVRLRRSKGLIIVVFDLDRLSIPVRRLTGASRRDIATLQNRHRTPALVTMSREGTDGRMTKQG
jgi:hypothetical protein